MPKKGSEAPLLLLDACCLINLFVTGRCEEILSVLPYRLATSGLVAAREVLSTGAALTSTENLALLDLVSEGELTGFVHFATMLDDGEASICALAVSRKAGVATDDRKAIRLLSQEYPLVSVVQTPELLYEWARAAKPAERVIREALHAVRDRARFYPRQDAPRFEWWAKFFPQNKKEIPP